MSSLNEFHALVCCVPNCVQKALPGTVERSSDFFLALRGVTIFDHARSNGGAHFSRSPRLDCVISQAPRLLCDSYETLQELCEILHNPSRKSLKGCHERRAQWPWCIWKLQHLSLHYPCLQSKLPGFLWMWLIYIFLLLVWILEQTHFPHCLFNPTISDYSSSLCLY